MTAFVDQATGEVVDLEQVQETVELWLTATRPRLRQGYVDELLVRGTQLARILPDLNRRLDRGLELLGGQGVPAVPADPAREAMWFDWLATYETACDLLSTIQYGVLCGHWDRVSTRKEA